MKLLKEMHLERHPHDLPQYNTKQCSFFLDFNYQDHSFHRGLANTLEDPCKNLQVNTGSKNNHRKATGTETE